MMGAQTVTGTLTDGKTIVLDQTIAVKPGPVRLTIEPAEPAPGRMALAEVLDELRRRQAARGHVPRTRDEIDRELKEERESWGD